MKALKLTALALGGGLLIVQAIAVVAGMFLDNNTAMMVTLPLALFIGLNARRGAEKLLGYTLLEAMKEDNDDAGN